MRSTWRAKSVTRHLTFSLGPRTCPGNTFMHQPGIMLGTLELNLKFTKAG